MGYMYRNGHIYDPKTNPIYYKGKNITKVYRNGVTYYFEWDGTISITDTYNLIGNGGATFGYFDDVAFTWYDVEEIELSDSFILGGNGGAIFDYTDNVDILIEPDEEYQIEIE